MLGQQPQPGREGANNHEEANRINWQKGMQGNPMLSNKAFKNLESQRERLEKDIISINNKIAELDPSNVGMKAAYEKVREGFVAERKELDAILGPKPTLQ